MLALSGSCRYFLYRPAADVMRRGIYSLADLVRQELLGSPWWRCVHFFIGKTRQPRSACCNGIRGRLPMCCKRLERHLSTPYRRQPSNLPTRELMLILRGIPIGVHPTTQALCSYSKQGLRRAKTNYFWQYFLVLFIDNQGGIRILGCAAN